MEIFEKATCRQRYDMVGGVNAVLMAALTHVHDVVIDHCETDEECRQEIINYIERIDT